MPVTSTWSDSGMVTGENVATEARRAGTETAVGAPNAGEGVEAALPGAGEGVPVPPVDAEAGRVATTSNSRTTSVAGVPDTTLLFTPYCAYYECTH